MTDWNPRTPVPSPDEVEAGKTSAGGYTAARLAQWGVPWPPPTGWKKKLRDEWKREHPGEGHAESGKSLVKVLSPCLELGGKVHSWVEVTETHHKVRMLQCSACGARAARPRK